MAADLDDLIAYLDASPSPWHAVASTTRRLDGFAPLAEHDAWSRCSGAGPGRARRARSSPGRFPTERRRRPASASAAPTPTRPVSGSSRGPTPSPSAGSSSPSRSTAASSTTRGSIGTSVWPVGWSSADGSVSLVDVREPIARVPQLAVHLDRGVNDTGLLLDPQRHLAPVWGVGCRTTRRVRRMDRDAGRPRRSHRPGGSSASTTCRVPR